jgi:hypothetical protein
MWCASAELVRTHVNRASHLKAKHLRSHPMTSVYAEVLHEIMSLYQGYSDVIRTTTQPHHLLKVRTALPQYQYHPEDLLIREPLIEHVGALPIVAVALHPHLDNPGVDLGRALIMLAIHDIGELGVGDEMAFTKNPDGFAAESEHALKLLHPSYHDVYIEVEELTTDTGCFAKSVDKITPDIIDLVTPPEITIERFRHYLNIEPQDLVPLIKKHKHPFMVWNKFLTGFHLEILRMLEEILKPYSK